VLVALPGRLTGASVPLAFAMASASVHVGRRKKSAYERRQQYQRAHARQLQHVISSLDALHHRGSHHSRLTKALLSVLDVRGTSPSPPGAPSQPSAGDFQPDTCPFTMSPDAPVYVPKSAMTSSSIVYSSGVFTPVSVCTPGSTVDVSRMSSSAAVVSDTPSNVIAPSSSSSSGAAIKLQDAIISSALAEDADRSDLSPISPSCGQVSTSFQSGSVAPFRSNNLSNVALLHDGCFGTIKRRLRMKTTLDIPEPLVTEPWASSSPSASLPQDDHFDVSSNCSDASPIDMDDDVYVSDDFGTINFSWGQSHHRIEVYIQIDLLCAAHSISMDTFSNICSVQFGMQALSVGLPYFDGFLFSAMLRHPIVPDDCSWAIESDGLHDFLIIKLIKSQSGHWQRFFL